MYLLCYYYYLLSDACIDGATQAPRVAAVVLVRIRVRVRVRARIRDWA